METLTTDQIRERYLDFFESQGHVRIPSAPLIPENDPTTLFTGSGMQPMLPYLLGTTHPLGRRIVDSQKAFRAVDIEEVGDNRHTTFFEMLGNWSLGDYFKHEQLSWMYTFLTQSLGLDPAKLYVTVFRGNESLGIPRDAETAQIWQELFTREGIEALIADYPEKEGLQNARIFYYDEKKNWWSRSGIPSKMPQGEPGGPDSEMFWDFGQTRQLHEQSSYKDQPCHVNCDCGRFMEIGNNVFMEYVKKSSGFALLPQKNVDFGGGLERFKAAHDNDPDIFHIDVFWTLRQAIESASGQRYGAQPEQTKAFRVIMDHWRAAVFLVSDGALPANKDQGYFTRRLLRRSMRFAQQLGVPAGMAGTFTNAVITSYRAAYPVLATQAKTIMEAIMDEEIKFQTTLKTGLKVFKHATAALASGDAIPSKTVFDLYQSYGFPIELTEELAREHSLRIDQLSFEQAYKAHQAASRTGAEQKFKGGLVDHSQASVHYHTATHLLHQALREVLGNHVMQRGSNITPQRLRFDFSHPQKMTADELRRVEELVNQKIQEDLPVARQEMSVPEAKGAGALGLFEHKYGDRVSVYSMGTFSREICGGPHVSHTGELGRLKISKEEAVSAGIRRIKAVLE